MKSYLSMIPISAKVHKRQNRMTILCIVIAVFLVTAVFSMAEMAVRQETSRLVAKHGIEEVKSLLTSESFISLIPVAVILFLFVLCAGVFMIAGSMNSNVAQRTQLFGMMRCIGMSRRQIIRYVRLEVLNWCKTAIPAGLLAGTVVTWILCAVLKFAVGGEWANMPQFKISILGIISGVVVGLLTVLIAAGKPARKAAKVTPVSALSGVSEEKKNTNAITSVKNIRIEKALGISYATQSKKNLFLMIGSFALSIILFLSFSVIVELVNRMMPQSVSYADIEIYSDKNSFVDSSLLEELNQIDIVKRAFGRRAIFDIEADCKAVPLLKSVDIISFGDFDIEALKKDKMLKKGYDLQNVVENGGALIITDENIKNGDTVSVYGKQIPVAGRLKYDPFSSDGSTGGKTTLIISDETFRNLTGISDYTMILVQLSNSATDKNAEAIKSMATGYKFSDNRENNTRGTYTAFLVCVYSFLLIIALVTVLNIVNNISMSVSARIKQYGAMRAVGMSKKQIGIIIKSETLTYASLGCGAGLLIGLLFSKWLYGFLVTSHYAYSVWQLPIAEIIIIIAFFILSVAAGIKAPIKRLNEMSVTETIGQL